MNTAVANMDSQSDPAHKVLEVEHLSKQYRLYDSPRARLRSLLLGQASYRSHDALHDLSFSLSRGQCLGLIGDNGAGKSTLLKLLTGTIQPTTGSIRRQGRITAILELGAGFHPDFSGRDNLYFGGSLIGIDASTMKKLEPEIVAFSELGVAIDRPVKTYSSGMVVRLAFALVTAVEPDVLIIDEALAVGDQHFQKKCVERIDAFRRNGCTILFCSHSLYHVRHLCTHALWLDKGRIRSFGETELVLAAYEAHVRLQDQASPTEERLDAQPASETMPPLEHENALDAPASKTPARIEKVQVEGLGGGQPPRLLTRDLTVQVEVFSDQDLAPSIGVMLEQHHGVGITCVATHDDQAHVHALGGGRWRATVTFTDLSLHTGEYVLTVYLGSPDGLVVLDERRECQVFQWSYGNCLPGLVNLPHRWS